MKNNTILNPIGLFLFLCILAASLVGCSQGDHASNRTRPDALATAGDSARKSDTYYKRAVAQYQDLISRDKDNEGLRSELGKLYFSHGAFAQAAEVLKGCTQGVPQRYLARAYYELGRYTDARDILSKSALTDDESRYYYGLTCEKLNLFDQAIGLYNTISQEPFKSLSKERSNDIVKHEVVRNIREVDRQVYDIIAAAPKADEYPQAGALILLADETMRVDHQYRQVSEVHSIVKILNERGKESFSETHIGYDSTYEKVELEYARTIKPTGEVVEVGSRHIRDVSKYLNFPLYSNARVLIISFPEIAHGSVVEYKATIYRNELINKKDFVLAYPVQSSEPILRADFSLELPDQKVPAVRIVNFEYNTFGAKLVPAVEHRQNKLVYTWHFKNIPQIMPESNMPGGVEINPAFLVSTFSSWKEIADWWWALAKDKINADADITAKVTELTAGITSDEARARALYNFCAKEIRYVAVEYGQAGYEPHAAGDVFRNKYGDCKDQAILLVTMLRQAGFDAWPVLIPTRDCYNLSADFYSMLFDHCIAVVSLGGKLIFLDPTAETCSFGDLPGADVNRNVLICKDNGFIIEKTPLFDADHNSNRQYLRLAIGNDESVEGTKKISTSGFYEQGQRYWLLYSPPELIQEALKQKIQDISIGGQLRDYSVENAADLNKQVILRYSFFGGEYFTVAGALRILPELAGFDTTIVARDKRTYPLDFGQLDSRLTEIDLVIPPGFKVKYLPQDVFEDLPWIACEVRYSQSKNTIAFRQRTVLKRASIRQGEYPAFKKSFEALAKKVKQSIVLERTP